MSRLPFDPIAEAHHRWVDHGWGAADVMAAVTSITRAHQLLMARINETLKGFDLTFARYEALVLLHFSSRGSLPLGRMGERLQVHPASITNVIDRLESDGLVERVPHPTDGRATLAALTDAGRARVIEATAALVDDRFGAVGLSDGDARLVTTVLETFRAAAGDFET